MAYASSNKIGINLAQADAGTTTDGENAKHTLGTMVTATDGSLWQYVQAGAAIHKNKYVCIDENFQAVHGTKALVDAGHGIGFCLVLRDSAGTAAVAGSAGVLDNDFFWACVHGPGNIAGWLAASCAADVQLYTTGTAGILDDTSASQTLIRGIVAVTASPS